MSEFLIYITHSNIFWKRPLLKIYQQSGPMQTFSYKVNLDKRRVELEDSESKVNKNINLFMPGDIRTSVVWTYQAFENNFGMKHRFTNYLKESCR